MTYKVSVTRLAERQINELVEHVATVQQEPKQALYILEIIWDAIATLERFPNRCPLAPENGAFDYQLRMLIIKRTLLLLFRVDEVKREVTVMAFRHAHRLPTSTSDCPGEG